MVDVNSKPESVHIIDMKHQSNVPILCVQMLMLIIANCLEENWAL